MPELIPAEPGSPDWLAARRAGVTATDIVTILGLSSYDSVYSLFWRKMGQVPDVPDSDRFRLGRALEDYIAQRWQEDHPAVWMTVGGLYRSTTRSWQMATTDCDLAEPSGQQQVTGVLELKSWADADKRSWDGGPPAVVRAQVLWQMDVMDVAAGHAGVVFLPSGRFRSYVIEHQRPPCDGFIGRVNLCPACQDIGLMRAAGEEFMGRLRLELPPPDPDSSLATLAAVRARFTSQPAKQAEIDRELWFEFDLASDALKYAEEDKRGIEAKIREQAGEASVLTVDGRPVARRVISDAHVKAHVRHQDYLKRITQGDDNGD